MTNMSSYSTHQLIHQSLILNSRNAHTISDALEQIASLVITQN